MTLVQHLVRQMVDAHPNIKHLHLGMDEVLLGACERCKVTSRERVYLEWAVKVCGWVRRTFPHLTPIIWDDMLRTISMQDLKASGIGSVTDVMVWKYDAGILQLPEGFLPRLSTVFSNSGVWFASAYKGATGAAQCLVPGQHHIDNHLAWVNAIREHGHAFPNFRGFALTGWQRYDHFSILCELLPAAVPCVVLCLKVLAEAAFTRPLHVEVSEKLGFQHLINLSPIPRPQMVEENLEFPGHGLFSALQMWANFCAMYSVHRNSEIVSGWYHHYRRRQQFVSPGVLAVVRPQCQQLLQSITELRHRLHHELQVVFDCHTTQEWLDCFVQPLMEKIARDWDECLALQRHDTAACDAHGMGPCTCGGHTPS